MTRDSPLLKFVDAADLSPSGGGGDALIPAGMPAGSCSPGAACDTESPFCAVLAPQPIAVREQKFNYILFDPIIRLEPPDNENLVPVNSV